MALLPAGARSEAYHEIYDRLIDGQLGIAGLLGEDGRDVDGHSHHRIGVPSALSGPQHPALLTINPTLQFRNCSSDL